MKLADAVLQVARIEQRLALGLDPHLSLQTLADWFDADYVPAIRQTNRSWRSDVSRFNTHIGPALGGRSVSEITPRDLAQLIAGLRPVPGRNRGREVLADSTTNRVIALIKVIFAKLQADGLIDNNPAVGLKLRRERNRRARVLRDVEIPRFFEALAAAPVKIRLLVCLLLLTGLRVGEALAARWADVDFDRGYLRVPDSKSGMPRIVPLSQEALGVCRELHTHRTNEFLFAGRSGGHLSHPGRRFRGLVAAANTPGFWLHDLRRTFATLAAQRVPIQDVSRFLGHSAVGVTERYVVTQDAGLVTTAAEVGAHLRQALAAASLIAPDVGGEI